MLLVFKQIVKWLRAGVVFSISLYVNYTLPMIVLRLIFVMAKKLLNFEMYSTK